MQYDATETNSTDQIVWLSTNLERKHLLVACLLKCPFVPKVSLVFFVFVIFGFFFDLNPAWYIENHFTLSKLWFDESW